MPTTKRPVYYSVYCVYSNLKHLLACQNFWIFYVTSRLTLYECVVNVYIQRSFFIRNWTTLGKIQDGGQDGDHFWWRHSPMAAPPPRKYSWFVTTWQGGHVGGQYNRIFSRRIYMKTEFRVPEERNAFVLDHQHGRRDVTCKPAIPHLVKKIKGFPLRVKSLQNTATYQQLLGGFHPPPPPSLYHGGGMNLRVRPKVKQYRILFTFFKSYRCN